jgi:diaminopimelate epimerase
LIDMATALAFTKLEALANDFVLIDARRPLASLSAAQIRNLGDRRRGIGFDQLLRLIAPSGPDRLADVEIFNSDGSIAEQCGNGMRAIALWLDQNGDLNDRARLGTAGGSVDVRVPNPDAIEAELPGPDFTPAAWGSVAGRAAWEAEFEEQIYPVYGVSTGNPHVVVTLDRSPDARLLSGLGRHLSQSDVLVHGANVNLARCRGRADIELAVYERGVGPTAACGSGACASAAVLMRAGRVDSPVRVAQPGGELVLHWSGEGPIRMVGPARRVFDGTITIPSLEP